MWVVDEETGNVTCRQGDSGTYIVEDLPTDKNYTLYFQVNDSKNRKMFDIATETHMLDTCTIVITPSNSDRLTSKDEGGTEYNFGIKLCYGVDEYEETLVIGDKDETEPNIITVYPKIVEGFTKVVEGSDNG